MHKNKLLKHTHALIVYDLIIYKLFFPLPIYCLRELTQTAPIRYCVVIHFGLLVIGFVLDPTFSTIVSPVYRNLKCY